ncbi:MAG: acyl-CoA synthetase, partial [Candidatus Dadabacteria bacterium]
VLDDEPSDATAELGAVRYRDAFAGQSDERDFEQRSEDDIFIVCTGGTTGFPKGVMWRHEDVFFAALQGGRAGGDPIERPIEIGRIAQQGDEAWTLYAAPPFIHGTAIYSALITFFAGGKLVISRSPSYDAARMVDLIERERIEVLVMVGDAMLLPFIREVEKRGDRADLSSLSVITSQGAILSASTRKRLEELLPAVMILNNFGATEAGHQGQSVTDDEDGGEDGRTRFALDENGALIDEELRVVEPKPGARGRIARKGHIPLGYYKDEKKTAETFIEVDGARWVIPGDWGEYDENGLVVLLGRGSICINSGGEKIYPEEVEEVLKGHPDIYDALVVGVPDERFGQRVAAVIQLEPGASAEPEAWREYLRSRLAGYKTPREWHVVDAVPRQINGKPDYKTAKAIAEAGTHRVDG